MKKGRYFTCKRLRMLEYLKKQGFTPTATIPDPTNDRYNWWLFEHTDALDEAITTYFELARNKQI